MEVVTNLESKLKEAQTVLEQRGIGRQVEQSALEAIQRIEIEAKNYSQEDCSEEVKARIFKIIEDTRALRICSTSQVIRVRSFEAEPVISSTTSPDIVLAPESYLEKALSVSTTESSIEDIEQPLIYSWGRSDLGALIKYDDSYIQSRSDYIGISLPSNRVIMQVASNTYHQASVTTTGEVYVSGTNEEGCISADRSVRILYKPRLLESLLSHRIVQVSCGVYHTACVTSTGAVMSFGGNEVGELGHSRDLNAFVAPKAVDGLAGKLAVSVACGQRVTFILTSTGEILSCGVGASNGHKHRNNLYRAERLESLAGSTIVAIASGASHALALSSGGELYGWGTSFHGELGLGDILEHIQTPKQIIISDAEGDKIIGISAGYSHSICWTEWGTLYGCGYNKYGQVLIYVIPRLRLCLPSAILC